MWPLISAGALILIAGIAIGYTLGFLVFGLEE